ncbi:MAG: GntR family transcriptional regulator, transcriptional repressor for pyruvate dehydrogenase complex [Tepidanaerobacteraceae bacterium]|nr:GntR family transcriptional regulator, transcriptional repressor for pyruvate dehydrogenase complex [Tepidanaerobacteraceae bacterium]
MDFHRVKNIRLYESIIEQIKNMVDKGEMQPGDKFPSERELMEKLGVSRAVLREAFRVLESRGLVESRPGGGRYLRRVEGFHLQQSTSMDLERFALVDVVEAREIVEVKVAKLAAERATEQEMKSLLAFDEEFHGSRANLAEYREKDRDLAFHMALAEMSHNFMLREMVSFMLNLTRDLQEKSILDYDDWIVLCEQHSDIVRAIVQRNGDDAAYKMSLHLQSLRRDILKGK